MIEAMGSYGRLVVLAALAASACGGGPQTSGTAGAEEPHPAEQNAAEPEPDFRPGGCVPTPEERASHENQSCAEWTLPTVIESDDAQKNRAEASRIYERGEDFQNLAEFSRAIEEFERAYQLAPEPLILYNIGRMHEYNHAPHCAADAYRIFLRVAPTSAQAQDAQERLTRLERERKLESERGPPPINYAAAKINDADNRCE